MTGRKMSFRNSRGQHLAGRLELAEDQPRAGFALLAHCFTCGKDLKGYYYLARTLAQAGFGVLRIDFTGLGESQGDFAATDLATNAEDLCSAAAWLGHEHAPPQLLIGHSLGGVAALLAASALPSVQAFVLLATPSKLAHLPSEIPEIRLAEESGAPVALVLGGQTHRIGPHFLESVADQDLRGLVQGLQRPLLVAHSPDDATTPVGHGEELFRWARQPKSFLALEGADHLLSRREDAERTGRWIAAWAQPHCGSEHPPVR